MNLKERIQDSLLSNFSKDDGEINYYQAEKSSGISRQSIMNWVKGKTNVYEMKLDNLMKLATATNRKVSWFLEEEQTLTKEVPQLSDLFVNPTPKTQALLVKLEQSLKNNTLTDDMAADIAAYLNVKLATQQSQLTLEERKQSHARLKQQLTQSKDAHDDTDGTTGNH